MDCVRRWAIGSISGVIDPPRAELAAQIAAGPTPTSAQPRLATGARARRRHG